jgi:hypothetical protein
VPDETLVPPVDSGMDEVDFDTVIGDPSVDEVTPVSNEV